MKAVFFAVLLAVPPLAGLSLTLANSGAIYRCGNDYLNDAVQAQARGCGLVEGIGASVTVTGTRVQSRATEPEHTQASTSPQAPAQLRVISAVPLSPSFSSSAADQRARDRDAWSILQAELAKAEALLSERQRELADPHRQTSQTSHLGDLQSSIRRHLSDVAGLKREISRLPLQSTLQSK